MAGAAGPETARGLLQLFYQDQKLVNDRGVTEMAAMQQVDGAWAAQQAVAKAAFADGQQQEAARVDPASIHLPVLLIWGEHDGVLPMQHAVDALPKFPDASLAIVRNVGHVPQVENPTRTANPDHPLLKIGCLIWPVLDQKSGNQKLGASVLEEKARQ